MKGRQHLGALLLTLAAFGACVSNTRNSSIPEGIPGPSESYIGRDICDYFPCYNVEDVFNSPRLVMSRTTASGDTIPLRLLRVHFIEKLEGKEKLDSILREELSSYPNVTAEEVPQYANILREQFNRGNIDYMLDFFACLATSSMSEAWYRPNENDRLMYRRTPIAIYKNDSVREENQPRVVVAPFGNGVIHVQFDRFNGSPGTYNTLCPLPPTTSPDSGRPIPAP